MAHHRDLFLLLLVFMLSGGSTRNLSGQEPFTEEAVARGVFAVTSFGFGGPIFGHGLACNDLDGDGDPDLVLTGIDLGVVAVYENDGTGNFIERTIGSGLPVSLAYTGVSCADYDADGDLDLYLTAWEEPDALMRNDGNFVFTNVATAAGVDHAGEGTMSAWGDYDGDGWLDLYVVNYAWGGDYHTDVAKNRLYHNEGDGTFTEVGAAQTVDDGFGGMSASFFDHDLDGDLDLYLGNDFGTGVDGNHNKLWRNDDGQFVDISTVSGAGIPMSNMGISVADMDGNGHLDLVCSNNPPLQPLILANGDGTYTESGGAWGFTGPGRGWGSVVWDYDNDTYLDAFICKGPNLNVLHEYNGTTPTIEVAGTVNIDSAGWSMIPGESFCAASGDIDGDGDVDLLVQTYNEPIAIYVNHEGDERNWLRLRLRGVDPNPFAIGAIVTIREGPTIWRQQLFAGTGFKCSNQFVLHFGMDDLSLVHELAVQWPNGELSLLESIATNQVLEIDQATAPVAADCDGDRVPDVWQIIDDPSVDTDGDGILDACQVTFLRGDVGGDSNRDVSDVIAILGHVFSASPLGCRDAADANDDGTLDVADPIYLLSFLFVSGPALPPPALSCGLDPTSDLVSDLGCDTPCP